MKQQRAFTLTELLVVVAIIATFSALLFSALPSVMKKVYETKCMSNLKTLHVGCSSYAADYQHWPTSNLENPFNPDAYGSHPWYYSLMANNYIPTRKVHRDGYACLVSDALLCPANKANKGFRWRYTSAPFPWSGNYGTSAFWGHSVAGYPGSPTTPSGAGIDRVRIGSIVNGNAILLIESTISNVVPWNDSVSWESPDCLVAKNIHGKGIFALLANGAVVLITQEEYPDPKQEKYWNPRYNP